MYLAWAQHWDSPIWECTLSAYANTYAFIKHIIHFYCYKCNKTFRYFKFRYFCSEAKMVCLTKVK